ncbi:MAG: non-canonical purine NTP pyrophosphatase [Phycisphaeraceae bacterium]|nr:non-canonical purine NTP pyrophosphatase [Phycisphaeraceae bacterium]
MQILLATSNRHKLEELRALLASHSGQPLPGMPQVPTRKKPQADSAPVSSKSDMARAIQWLTLNDLPTRPPEPVEDGDSFEANALLKARHYAAATSLITLADDSGLEVDALGGQPGVRSARYAGITGPRTKIDVANYQLLLNNLTGVPREKRSARFVCAMALVHGRDEIVLRGSVEGQILETPRGENGFGYDPVFYLPQLQRSAAELSSQQKNAVSHRGAAVRLMWPRIQERIRR